MSIETQQELATDFVREVVARFGIDAITSARRTEDDGIYISVDGDNLGSWSARRARLWRLARADQDGRPTAYRGAHEQDCRGCRWLP